MINVDLKELKKMERTLKAFKDRALPFATKHAINSAAFDARRESQEELQKGMILRNKWTERSVRVEQTRSLEIRRQWASVGSVADYLETQEFGGQKSSAGEAGVAIPTSFAAGLGESAKPRTKLPRKPNKLQNIVLRKRRVRAKSKSQALLIKAQQAVQTGKRMIYHETNDGTMGIFKVVGGRKSKKGGWPRGAQIKMVWDMSERTVRIPRRPWLAPSVRRTQKKIPGMYYKSLRFQLQRHNLLKKV